MVIWRLLDGKTGHEKQTLGLSIALSRQYPSEVIDLRVATPIEGWKNWLLGKFPAGNSLNKPDLILAAGHATHIHLLAAARATRAKTILCMKPTLPYRCFDLCLVPEHDSPRIYSNVIPTRGALNAAHANTTKEKNTGLFLIGGESKHYAWDNQTVINQIKHVIKHQPEITWTLTTSRRTPTAFLEHLRKTTSNVKIVPNEGTYRGWIEEQLSRTEIVWATPDSANMVYEGLTAGCATGIFPLTPISHSRIQAGLDKLIAENWISNNPTQRPPTPTFLLNEADRCARIILDRFFPKRLSS